jgi:glucose/arabinose dehydrogenase
MHGHGQANRRRAAFVADFRAMKPSSLRGMSLCTVVAIAGAALVACSGGDKHLAMTDSGTQNGKTPRDSGTGTGKTLPVQPPGSATDAGQPTIPPSSMLKGSLCSLPGSYVKTAQGMAVVAGGVPSLPDLSWLTVPTGYCIHHFAHVAETRQLRVSSNGDVFVSSPSMITAGTESEMGVGAIVVLPDDDHDGVADSTQTFIDNLPQTQGLVFAGDYMYFQDATSLKRVKFKVGDRKPSAAPEPVTSMKDTDAQQFPFHWPKLVDVAKDGTVYFSNGSDQDESCYSPAERAKHPATGVVFKVAPGGELSIVAQGFRNPIAMRCEQSINVCLLVELGRDGSGAQGGREKIVPIRQGDDWGFPCCATKMTPYEQQQFQDPQGEPMSGQLVQPSDCAGVAAEDVALKIGDTPFGIDFEGGRWDAPWQNRAFVTMHGAVGSFIGSRVVAIALDPMSGMPEPSSDLDGILEAAPNMMDFVTGWDDGTLAHGRATALAFGDDGRLYIGDDTHGEIFWIAPVNLMQATK